MYKSILLIGLLSVLSGFNNSDNKVVWVVLQGSSLSVNGSTNINTFQCDIANYNRLDTIVCVRNKLKGLAVPMNGNLNLSIEAFDCHNRLMTSDLRKTLKYKDYPILTIKFISIDGFPDFKTPNRITGLVDIALAGISKRFEINYVFTTENNTQVLLKGNQNIHFSDFNLIAPSKLGGVIKAKDELKVEFKLNLKSIS